MSKIDPCFRLIALPELLPGDPVPVDVGRKPSSDEMIELIAEGSRKTLSLGRGVMAAILTEVIVDGCPLIIDTTVGVASPLV